jgi:LmbE family N-acetylglucosaminyl deacetylase
MSQSVFAHASDQFERAPLQPAGSVGELGPTLVIAPHPDDEVLGCGGLIALLRRVGTPVRVIVVSDGAASHPGSKAYPPPVLGRLRRAESEAGLRWLRVATGDVTFLGLPDGAIPRPDGPDRDGPDAYSGDRPAASGGNRAVDLARSAILASSGFETVLLPWRRDPHDDHRATWALFSHALDELRSPARRLEYPIWSRVHPGTDDLPRDDEAVTWRLDLAGVGTLKRVAILAHRSQTTGLIDDADIGECLTRAVLERFFQPWEPFIELRSAALTDAAPAMPSPAAP